MYNMVFTSDSMFICLEISTSTIPIISAAKALPIDSNTKLVVYMLRLRYKELYFF